MKKIVLIQLNLIEDNPFRGETIGYEEMEFQAEARRLQN